MDRWELHEEGRETEVYDSPAELGAAVAERLESAGDVAAFRLACIGDDGAERDPTAVEQAAIAAAMEREDIVKHVHIHKDDAGSVHGEEPKAGNRVQQLREAAMLTPGELGEVVGGSSADIERYEAGEPIPPAVAERLAATFAVSLPWLRGED